MPSPKAHVIDTIEFVVSKDMQPGQKLLRMARDGRLLWVTIPENAIVEKTVTIKIDKLVPQSNTRYLEVLEKKREYKFRLSTWKAKRGMERAASNPKAFTQPRPTPPIYYPIPTSASANTLAAGSTSATPADSMAVDNDDDDEEEDDDDDEHHHHHQLKEEVVEEDDEEEDDVPFWELFE